MTPPAAVPWWRSGGGAAVWSASLVTLMVATAAMLALRGQLDKAHVVLVYLLIVLGGSAAGGRVLGLTLAALAFVLFDYLFLTPYGTLVVANPLDWLVLVTFLLTSVVAAQLLTRAQEQATAARARTAEVERLSALGAETLNAVRAEDALLAIAGVIRSALLVDLCEIYVHRTAAPELSLAAHAGERDSGIGARADAHSLLAWVSEHGQAAVERLDGTLRVAADLAAPTGRRDGQLGWPDLTDVHAMALPLRVRDRTVGVLRLVHAGGIQLAPSQREFLIALSYYAALGVERMRLTADAAHADALREADRLKDALLAAVSHDLRTPLTTVKALAQAIGQQGVAAGDPRAISIEEEADRLTALVADLLDLSRLTGGAIRMRPEVNTAEDLIGAAVQRTSGVLGARELRVMRAADAPMLVGRFDFVHALRSLVNLIENAAKYSPPGTAIEVGAQQEGHRLVFTVSDRGPGVAEGERERIFEPFYRPAGVPADVRGAGLGLTIARGLALAQQGNVRYAPRPGGGSIFRLELPALDALAPDTDRIT